MYCFLLPMLMAVMGGRIFTAVCLSICTISQKTNSVVSVAEICKLVGVGLLTCYPSASGKYRSVKARVVNRCLDSRWPAVYVVL